MALVNGLDVPDRAMEENGGDRQQAQLIQLARAGDAFAWEQIMKAHQTPVFRLAYLMLEEVADADDVAQEAFVRAFKRLASFDQTRSLRPWLLGITANLARNRKRGLGRYWAMLGRYWRSAPAQDVTGDFSSESLRALALQEAVRNLKQSQREIIYLRFFLELSVSEAAQALGVAPGTVKSRTSRALAQLRRLIKAEFPELAPSRPAVPADGVDPNE